MSTRIKTIELFLACGFATAVGTQAVPTNAHETDNILEASTSQTYLLAQSAEGGEGGEGAEGGGEGGTATGDPNVDYMTSLGLMKGHLLVAKELMAQKNYEEAEPHIGHPVEELYSDIETVLPEKGVSDFKPTLNQLHDLAISAPDSPEMKTLFAKSEASIDEAIAAVPQEQRNSPEFVLNVMVEMLKNAEAEYKAAIANNQFVEVVEYQDSRGFVFYADQLYQTVADQKSQADPEGHKVITDSLAELKTAWPSIEPPAKPIKQPGEISALVTQIEFNK
ncbi:hypothetical protein [Pleurocapsa sp. FMAR1]|uniref:hypothetical protein n=1 Tax=Pleurocapsa sp. FMAR1 TaxID=3040204 RepID=UPI0029C73F5A|nr:hypothetical protein [Pleurocapsa sp. FMAR1]